MFKYSVKVLLSLLLLSLKSDNLGSVEGHRECPKESARNIPSGSINVISNTGWVIGGWGFASPFNARNYGDGQFNWGSSNFGFGNFGDNNMGNRNYGDGNMGDGNLGDYNVGWENCGSNNVGRGNNGQWNVGNVNSGSYNLGKGNTGQGNTGIVNDGNNNVGGLNTGANNLGISNSGQSNYGFGNAGVENVGWSNSGQWNIGEENIGLGNVGSKNLNGSFNLGYLNLGSNNTGANNYGQGNVGYLAGVQYSTINTTFGSGEIYWKNITNLVMNSIPAVNSTGWANLNDTNVGIAQSGSRNIGGVNVGLSNIGVNLNGTQNTGWNLTGIGLIGYDQQPGPGSNFTGVTIQGLLSPLYLFNSSVYGFLQDTLVEPFPDVYNQYATQMFQTRLTPFNPDTCPSFTPVPISNTFSVSVKCRGSVKITDLYCSGDSYIVYKDGRVWFTTPVVSLDNDPRCLNSQPDPEEAFYDPEFSHHQAWLPPGSYKITVVPAATRWGGGAVAIKVDDFCDRTVIGDYIRY